MRRRQPATAYDVDGVPKALLIGLCIDVWSTETVHGGAQLHAARRNYLNAREAWLNNQGVPLGERSDLLRGPRHPYSVEFLVSHGNADQAAQYLARGDSTIDDLPALRDQALALITRTRESR